MQRRKFIQQSALLGAGIMLTGSSQLVAETKDFNKENNKEIIIKSKIF